MKKILMGIITFLVVCLSIWFQMLFLNEIPLVGVIANFGIVLIGGIGLISGKLLGAIVGGVYGLLIDISYGRGIGVYFSLYLLVGLGAGFLNRNFSKGNRISMIMLVLLFTALFETLAYFFSMVLYNINFDIKAWISVILLESVYNVLLTIIFFKPISFLGDILNRCKNSYYLL